MGSWTHKPEKRSANKTDRQEAKREIECDEVLGNPPREDVSEPVTLLRASTALLRGLPAEDQDAIKAAVGTRVMRVGTDSAGNAEVEFCDAAGVTHLIWVDPKDLAAVPN